MPTLRPNFVRHPSDPLAVLDVQSEPRALMPCPVCHALPIPKDHAHYGPELLAWLPTQPPFTAPKESP